MPALRDRSESVIRLVTSSELPLARLKRDGRASAARIAGLEADIARTSRAILAEWFDQAHRLAVAREHHGLKGAAFREFAESIGVGGSDAFLLEQLDGHREAVFDLCEAMDRFPGWRTALEMVQRPQNPWGRLTSAKGFVPNRPVHHIHIGGRLTTEVPADWQTEGDEWRTPDHLFQFLNGLYPFTVDVAATAANTKVKRFYDKAHDGLKQDWTGEVAFMNCPFSVAGKWTAKADHAGKHGAIVVGLLPNRSATGWYRDHIVPNALIVLLHGRIPFVRRETAPDNITMSGAPFASIVVVWPRSAGDRILKFSQPTSTVMMEMPPL